MHIQSSYGGYGRNVWSSVNDDGEVIVKNGAEITTYIIKDSVINEVITRKGREKTHLVYGEFYKVSKNGKLVQEEYYREDSIRAIAHNRLFYRKVSPTYVVERHSSGYSMYKEVVYYRNGQLMYSMNRGNRNIKVFDKTGNLLIRIRLEESLTFYSRSSRPHLDVPQLKKLNSVFEGKWYYETYKNGKVYSWIKGEGSVPIEGYRRGKLYFMRGIMVPKAVITGKYDAKFILNYPNATIRSDMLKAYGIDRLVHELKGETIEKKGDYELISLPILNGKKPDDVMKALKMRCPSTSVYFVLRVPPQSENIVQAINWTYGAEIRDLQEGKADLVEILVET